MQGPHLMTALETVKNGGCARIILATFLHKSSQSDSCGKQRKYVVFLVVELIIAYAVHFIHLRIRAVRRCA